MLNKSHNSIVTLAAVLLALVGVSKPAKAFLLAQASTAPTTFTVPDTLPSKAKVDMSTSNSTNSINQSLKESFTNKFPKAEVNIETQSSEDALQALSEGNIDLVGIGRNLTETEKQKGFVAVPISREKIAIVVSKNNPYDGNLTISQFAQIFRGEITDWSEIGGEPGAINLVDSPDTNDTRQAFPSYPVFQEGEFVTGSNALQLDQDSTDEMIAQLGSNGISYAVANDVINRDDVKIVTMHQTQPDDERYPFSQPFYLVYQGTPSPATEAFIGFSTAQGGEQVVENRVGSMSTAAAVAIASKLGNKASNAPTGTADLPETTLDGEGDLIEPDVDATSGDVSDADADVAIDGDNIPDADADVDATSGDVSDADVDAAIDGDNIPDADADVDAAIDGDNIPGADADVDAASGDVPDADVDAAIDDDIAQANPDLEGSGEINQNPDLEGSGEINQNPDLEGSGEINQNPDLEGSGEVNPGLEGSGEANPDLEDSGKPNAAIDTDGNIETAPGTVVPDDAEGEGAVATAKKGKWWWWLPLILGLPILAAIAISSFVGKKKSDQEPAIGTSNGNIPDGGGRSPNLPDGGDLSAVGANTATGVGNVGSNAINTTSKLGGAAVAGGAAAIGGTAAAASFVKGKKSTEKDLDDNIDITLDDTNINDSVIDEIPSNPVNEFTTGQETKLQLTDQPTKLQTDAVEDLDGNASGLLDGISNTGSAAVAGGTAAIGGATAAASGFFGDRADSSDTENTDIDSTTISDQGQTTPQTGFVSEQTTKLQTNDVDSDFDTDTSQEFRGDFVLDEETTGEFSVDTDTNIEDTRTDSNTSGLVDGISNKGSAALAGGAAAIGGAAAATSGFFGDRTEPSDTEDIDLDTNISGFTTDGLGDVQTPEVDTNIDTDIEEINLDGNVSENLRDFDTNISGFTTDRLGDVQTPEVDTNIDDTKIKSNTSGWLDDISNKGSAAAAGGAAAIGGAAAAASGFFSDRADSSDTEDTDIEVNTNVSGFTTDGLGDVQTPEVDTNIDTDIEEINLDENVSENLGDVDADISSFAADGVGNIQTPEVDTNIDDTETKSNTSGWLDSISNKGSAAAAGGAAAIGGAAAAASGFFGDRADSSDIEDTEFDTNISSDFSTDSGFANNVIADAETKSENVDTSLDNITFDDVDTSINASLEETSLERIDNSADISLDDITFDDVDTSIDASLEETSLERINNSADISLDDITFDDVDTSIDASLEETNLERTDNSADISLDDITFDDVDTSSDISLDDITFNDTEDKSTDNIIDNVGADNDNSEINFDNLGFDESKDDATSDLLSGNAAKITDLSDDRSNDMNNISTWLDSLETPSQNSEDISGWLDQLSIQNNDSESDSADDKTVNESGNETEDISFQFLEDLLERDSDKENS